MLFAGGGDGSRTHVRKEFSRYNSPDMSGVHRTVRCAIEAMDTSAPTATCSALNARQRAQKSDTPMLAHRTLHSACPVHTGHPGGPNSQSSNGRNPNVRVTWLAHRTCPVCTGLSGAPYDRQPALKRLVWWFGWRIITEPVQNRTFQIRESCP